MLTSLVASADRTGVVAQDDTDLTRTLFIDAQHRRRIEFEVDGAQHGGLVSEQVEVDLGGVAVRSVGADHVDLEDRAVSVTARVIDGDVLDDGDAAMGHRIAQVADGDDVDARRILGRRWRSGRGCGLDGGCQGVPAYRSRWRDRGFELMDALRDVGDPDGAEQQFGRVDGAVGLGVAELAGVRPLVADLAQLLGVGLGLSGHGLVERIAEVAESFGHRAQHQGQVATLVFATASALCDVLCPDQLGPVGAWWQEPVEHLADKRREATGQRGQCLPDECVTINGVHCLHPYLRTSLLPSSAYAECPCGITRYKSLYM